jgi:hypothetical protein
VWMGPLVHQQHTCKAHTRSPVPAPPAAPLPPTPPSNHSDHAEGANEYGAIPWDECRSHNLAQGP